MALAALLLSLGNRMFNYHLHRLASGQVIAHAHPYKRDNPSPLQHHRHTTAELAWLEQLSDPLFVMGCAAGFMAGLAFLKDTVFPAGIFSAPHVCSFLAIESRGPPACL